MSDGTNKQFDDALMVQARSLATDVQPERDLWPAIEAAIGDDAAGANHGGAPFAPWHRYLAQAAAVILLVGASSGLTWLATSDRHSVTPVASNTAVPLDALPASFGSQYTLGPGFQDARRDLEGRLDEELEKLSPEARAEVESNIATIRKAIDEISQALSDEPDNVLLQELLLSSYQEELALMRQVNGITSHVMLRNDI